MAHVAVLGTGLLGTGFSENLLSKGTDVVVWNRTPDKLSPLLARGARAAASPAEAMHGAARVHLILTADDAVDAVLDAAEPAWTPDVWVIDHSTSLPERVAARYTGSGRITVTGGAAQVKRLELTGSGGLGAEGEFDSVESIVVTGSGGVDLGVLRGCNVQIKATGSGHVRVDDVEACDLSVDHSGSGRIELSGAADSIDLVQSGSGGFGQTELVVSTADLSISGTGGAELTVTQSVDAVVSGTGGIVIHGNPAQRDVSETGTGRVRFQD